MNYRDKTTCGRFKKGYIRRLFRGVILYRSLAVFALLFLVYQLGKPAIKDIILKDSAAEQLESENLANLYGSVQPPNDDATLPSMRSEIQNTIQKISPSKQPISSKSKTILLWNNPKTVSYPLFIDPRCGSCQITTDRSRLRQSDGVVFHFRDMRTLPQPKDRLPHQLYVWLCRESPSTTKAIPSMNLMAFPNYFNATMTYRRDSDIFFPYVRGLSSGEISPFLHQDPQEILSSKRHLVAWVVSNCGTSAAAQLRMLYVESLIKFGIEVHRFGRCFKDKSFPSYRSLDSFAKLNQYKFYLAFENSIHCRDYVTEKFWKNSLLSGTVPIVWGPHQDDVTALAPPGSFVYAPRSPLALAARLKELDRDDKQYLSFFKWRQSLNRSNAGFRFITKEELLSNATKPEPSNWMIEGANGFGYCELCRNLNSIDQRPVRQRTVANLHDWWYGNERTECLW